MAKNTPDLSIIILNYNVKDLLLDCLNSIFKNQTLNDNWQIIVVDNASEDNSIEAVKEKYADKLDYILNKENLGFGKGNNSGLPKAKAETTLFLNPDTLVIDDVIQKSFKLLHSDEKTGAVGCRTEFADGRLDYSAHRGFPTPWNSLAYFSGLAKIFPKSKFFAGYTASYLDINKTAEMDCGAGSFMMVKKKAGDQVGWWDPDYFWNGEDIEFYYSLKEKGWKIMYLADGKIVHFKGSSSGLQKTAKLQVPRERKIKSAKAATQAMRIFYMKHYYQKYPPLLRDFILLGITALEKYRLFKINTGLKYG